MSAFLHPIPPSAPWVSPVFVPTVRMRRKDRDFLDLRMHEEVRMAVADRWGLGPVFDLNPSGAFYDLVPPSQHPAFLPEAPEWPYPIAPAGYPRRGRGSFAADTKPGQRIVQQVKSLFQPQDPSLRRQAGQLLAPQAPAVSVQTAAQRQESVATTVLAAGAVAAVAFAAGFLVGRMTTR